MIGPRGPAVAAAALALAVATAGCGVGAGEAAEGEAELTVTSGYGAEVIAEGMIEDPRASDSVLRALDREAEITTRYGGGFVQSIDGLAGGTGGGRSQDWFFYVNGIESPVGSADVPVEPGDRIWWDHHDWTDVMRVPAVVGSYPQPFEAAAEEPIEIGCAGEPAPCERVARALESDGVAAEVVAPREAEAGARPRFLVGELAEIGEPATAMLRAGPERSGVFARAAGDGLELLDERAEVARAGAHGLVAATAGGEDAPTWVVTGTAPGLVADAAGLLERDRLERRFAVAVDEGGEIVPLPVR